MMPNFLFFILKLVTLKKINKMFLVAYLLISFYKTLSQTKNGKFFTLPVSKLHWDFHILVLGSILIEKDV